MTSTTKQFVLGLVLGGVAFAVAVAVTRSTGPERPVEQPAAVAATSAPRPIDQAAVDALLTQRYGESVLQREPAAGRTVEGTGLRLGDRIVAINGQALPAGQAITRVSAASKPFVLTVIRDGERVDVRYD